MPHAPLGTQGLWIKVDTAASAWAVLEGKHPNWCRFKSTEKQPPKCCWGLIFVGVVSQQRAVLTLHKIHPLPSLDAALPAPGVLLGQNWLHSGCKDRPALPAIYIKMYNLNHLITATNILKPSPSPEHFSEYKRAAQLHIKQRNCETH